MTDKFEFFFVQLKLCNLKPNPSELTSLKLSSFKFETDYKAYIEEEIVEEDTAVDFSEVSLELNDFSEKFNGIDLKLDLVHSNQEKLSSELVDSKKLDLLDSKEDKLLLQFLDLKKFVSNQFKLLSEELSTMQSLFSSVFADADSKVICFCLFFIHCFVVIFSLF